MSRAASASAVGGPFCVGPPLRPCVPLSPGRRDLPTGSCPPGWRRPSSAHILSRDLFPTEVDITLFPHEVLLTGPRAWGHFSSTSGCFFLGVRHAVGTVTVGTCSWGLRGLSPPSHPRPIDNSAHVSRRWGPSAKSFRQFAPKDPVRCGVFSC